MDEPTAALDAKAAALVEELIRFQMLAGRCVLLVSHDTGQIARLADARLLLGPNAMRERGAAA
jgi:tungstate transport system ATP-binding protein